MHKQYISEMLSLLPNSISDFAGSEYPMPIRTTFLGDEEISIQELKKELIEKQNDDVKEILEPLLLSAELYEASCSDKGQFFINDLSLQSYVFNGSKWKAGWVLILGGRNQTELIQRLKEKNFMVFTDMPDVPDTVYIGSRDTSPVYFLQMMVRYGLIWGRIKPGDDHEMGHFLEKDMPGFIIICEDLPELKYLIALGLIKLGAPAIVPSTFPFPYGNRVVADSIDDIVDSGMRFSNLRLRYYKNEIIGLPDFCNVAFANEKIEIKNSYGSGANSFLCVKPAEHLEKSVNVVGTPCDEIGILIEIENEHLSDDMALIVEQAALKSINYLPGVKAYENADILKIGLAAGVSMDTQKIADAIYYGIRLLYPRLEKIKISFICEPSLLAEEAQKIRGYKLQRKEYVANMNEENTEEFVACTDCRPFSLVHTCIIPPDRIPMCSARTYFSCKADLYFGITRQPYQRQTEKEVQLRCVFNKGAVLDAEKGEYEGCNSIYSKMTGGKLNRMYLHSLRNYPHTSCGCFKNLAFWIEEVKGIGIMSRYSKAIAPNGKSWELLANYAGGKQSNGIMGVSLNYIHSKKFLKADGGIGNVVWVDSELYKNVSKYFLEGQKVATEKDVQNINDLKKFVVR